MELVNYDQFFIELEKKLRSSPECRAEIIKNAVRDSQCPYLKSRIETLCQACKIIVLLVASSLSVEGSAQVEIHITEQEADAPYYAATSREKRCGVMCLHPKWSQCIIPFGSK